MLILFKYFISILIQSTGSKTRDFEVLISCAVNILYVTFHLHFNVKSEKCRIPTSKEVNMYVF